MTHIRRKILKTLLIAPLGFVKGLFGSTVPTGTTGPVGVVGTNVTETENPTVVMLRQLTVFKDHLIPFWGHGKTTMEFAPDSEGNIPVRYYYHRDGSTPYNGCYGGIPHKGYFLATKDMAVSGPDGTNPLLKHVANHFREWMLGMPYNIRMHGGRTQYPTDAELAGGSGSPSLS